MSDDVAMIRPGQAIFASAFSRTKLHTDLPLSLKFVLEMGVRTVLAMVWVNVMNWNTEAGSTLVGPDPVPQNCHLEFGDPTCSVA